MTQLPLIIHTAKEMEKDIRYSITRIQRETTRKLFIKYQASCIKRQISQDDDYIKRRANELDLQILSLTMRSCTLRARSLQAYHKAFNF